MRPALWQPDSWPDRRLGTKVLGIDGHGGAGKSTLAALLADRFGAQIVHTDDFASMENPADWWPDLISAVFQPLSRGATSLSYPRSTWWDDPRSPVEDQPVTPVLILEGVSALRSEFRPYLSFGVFVDVPFEEALRRGISRDLADGHGPPDEVEASWMLWYQGENEYLERDHPEQYADLVIDGLTPFEDQM